MTNMRSIHYPALVQSPAALSWQTRYGRRLNPADLVAQPLLPQFSGTTVEQSVAAADTSVVPTDTAVTQTQADAALLAQITAQAVNADARRKQMKRRALWACAAVIVAATMMGGE